MKLRLRYVLIILYSILLLNYVETTGQLFQTLNENQENEENVDNWSSNSNNSDLDNNFLGFLQKDTFFNNPRIIPGNDNSENLHFKASKHSAQSGTQTSNDSQQGSGDSILKRSSLMGYNNRNTNRNYNTPDTYKNGYSSHNKHKIQENSQQNKIDIKRIEREGIVDSNDLQKNSDIQGVPGGENFSKIIQVENVHNDNANVNSNSQPEQNPQTIIQASIRNINKKIVNQAHRNINTHQINQANHKKMQKPSPQKVIRKYNNKHVNNQIPTKAPLASPRNHARNKRQNQNSDDLNMLVPPTQVKLTRSYNNYSHQKRSSHNFHNNNLRESSTSIYHSNSPYTRTRSHQKRYKELKLRKSTRTPRYSFPPSRVKPQKQIKNSSRKSNNKKVKTNKKKQLVYRLDSNNKEIIALKKRINILIKMNNKLLKQIQSSPLLNQEKKTLSKRIVNFIEKVKGLKKRNLKKMQKDVENNFNSLRNRYENLEDKMLEYGNSNEEEE